MQENSAEVGTYLLTGLAKLRDKYEIIGDVRGKGLQIGVEMVKDKVKEADRLNEYTATFIHIILDTIILYISQFRFFFSKFWIYIWQLVFCSHHKKNTI